MRWESDILMYYLYDDKGVILAYLPIVGKGAPRLRKHLNHTNVIYACEEGTEHYSTLDIKHSDTLEDVQKKVELLFRLHGYD